MPFDLETLGARIAERRGLDPIRKAAAEIGIGHATLARIEAGNVPDLETFAKICAWLGDSPDTFFEGLGEVGRASASVHFRAKKAPSKDTAVALGELIIKARAALAAINPI